MVRIAIEDPRRPDVVALLAGLDAHLDALYPPQSCHRLDLGALTRPEATFLVARDGAAARGCGALVAHEGWGEIKRMMVDPAARGRGIGRALLRRLEAQARMLGLACLRLETGVSQPEALALYRGAGFAMRPPLTGCAPDPLILLMEKTLEPVGLRRAGEADAGQLRAMVTAFHAGEGRAASARTLGAVDRVCRGEPLAEAWLIERRERVDGYLLLTRGFGFEFGGPDLFLDELYLAPRARGHGLAAVAMAFVERRAQEIGAMAMFLVVAPGNRRARRLYDAHGYETSDWVLMGRYL